MESCQKKSDEPRKQTGKKEKGLGKGIFASLPVRQRRTMGGSVSAIPLLGGRQNREIFFSLIEKNFGGARFKKMLRKFSCFARCSEAEANGSAGRDLFKIRKRILIKESSNFV